VYVGGGAKPADAAAILAPVGESVLPSLRDLGCVRLDAHVLPQGFCRIDPRREIRRQQIRKREQQVGQIAFGIDRDDRNAVDGRLLDEAESETGLAAARHPDADGVREQVLRVVENGIRQADARCQVVPSSEVEQPQFFVVGRHEPSIMQAPRADGMSHRAPRLRPSDSPNAGTASWFAGLRSAREARWRQAAP
jgi:hypothetical protein